MVSIDDRYCIDAYEGSLVELVAPEKVEGVERNAKAAVVERPFSPFEQVKGRHVKAQSKAGVTPQAYVSRNEADVACKAAHKRLCTEDEWVHACRGKRPTTFPYGDQRKAGHCNDGVITGPLVTLFASMGDGAYGFEPMNDGRLNQQPGTVARTGSFKKCRNSYGVYDMVGNVHEWVEDPAGTFRGGYYLDTHVNGDGCDYRTTAHDASYHDYSTGFRCCSDRTP